MTLTDKKVNKEIQNLGLQGTLSHTKFVPEQYKFASIDDRIELLRGLIDTDGYIYPTTYRVEYSTASKRLCDDFCFVARSLGAKVTVYTKQGSYKKNGERIMCKSAYRIFCMFDDRDIFVTLERKKVSLKRNRTINKNIKFQKSMRRCNLTPLAEEWFAEQFALFVGEEPEKRDVFDFDVREFGQFVVRHVYDYQVKRKWEHVAHKTAFMLNYEQRSVNKIIKKYRKIVKK